MSSVGDAEQARLAGPVLALRAEGAWEGGRATSGSREDEEADSPEPPEDAPAGQGSAQRGPLQVAFGPPMCGPP